MHGFRRRAGLLWPCLGLAGASLVALTASGLLASRPVRWWWQVTFPGGHTASLALFWCGVAALCGGWLGLGVRMRRSGTITARDVLAIAALWALPIALGPALFSLDMYSYFAQGTLLHAGLNPYHATPAALGGGHEAALLSTVSPKWRHTTAPYGPLFLLLAGRVAAVAGSHVVLGVLLLRAIELVGVAALAAGVSALASALRADVSLALWLAVCGPLTLLSLIGGGHNDALMGGLLACGVALALRHRWLAAIAVCSLAAAVKLPALAGVLMIAACWAREGPVARWRNLALAAGVCAAVLFGAGLLAGVGVSWLGGGVFSTPGAVRLAITPATAVGVTVADLVRGLGGALDARGLETAAVKATSLIVALFGAWLLVQVRTDRLVRYLGGFLLAAAVFGPAAWPWYLIWGVALLAADPCAQRRGRLAGLIVVSALVIDPGGQVWIPRPDAPFVLALYALIAALAIHSLRRRRRRRPSREAGQELAPAPARAAG